MKIYKIIIATSSILFLSLSVAYSLAHISKQKSNASLVSRAHLVVYDQQLNVPVEYIKPGSNTKTGSSLYLIASWRGRDGIQPNISADSLNLNKSLIKILLADKRSYPDLDFSILSLSKIKQFQAEKLGEEYGLIHWGATDKRKNWEYDIWVENVRGETDSFIVCQNKNDISTFQRCTHTFADQTFFYTVDYEIGNLKDWQEIQRSIIKLIDSFKIL